MQLHILGGDATANAFQKTGIPGDVIVWHEILSDGPTPGDVSEQEFWKIRQKYITEQYAVCPEEYVEKDGFSKLQSYLERNSPDEIVLWFGNDLVCQINAIYLISRLKMLISAKISLISLGKDTVCPGTLTTDQLKKSFTERQILSDAVKDEAMHAWQAYTSATPVDLEQLLQSGLASTFIKDALEKHRARFPACSNGLGFVEQSILETIYYDKKSEAPLIIERCLNTLSAYGLTDLQVLIILKQFRQAKLITEENGAITITELGKWILSGHVNYLESNGMLYHWLGGVRITATNKWCFDSTSCALRRQ